MRSTTSRFSGAAATNSVGRRRSSFIDPVRDRLVLRVGRGGVGPEALAAFAAAHEGLALLRACRELRRRDVDVLPLVKIVLEHARVGGVEILQQVALHGVDLAGGAGPSRSDRPTRAGGRADEELARRAADVDPVSVASGVVRPNSPRRSSPSLPTSRSAFSGASASRTFWPSVTLTMVTVVFGGGGFAGGPASAARASPGHCPSRPCLRGNGRPSPASCPSRPCGSWTRT